jgi:hypothetical protein
VHLILDACKPLFLIWDLQERNVVPSLQKALNDISLEKDAAVVAKVFNTCLSLQEYLCKNSGLLIVYDC